ncbi:MAG TPA: TolC family protein [Pyrinomonadaceae bacterium]|nr:TolC family protein [Pyrinomonadaceae bacterium]
MTKAPSAVLLAVFCFSVAVAQSNKTKSRANVKPAPPAASELEQLRKQYVETTKEYKASLEKLLDLYKASVKKAEARRDKSKELFKEGLISRTQFEDSEQAVADEQLKIAGVQNQMKGAETQISQTMLEMEGEKEIARLRLKPKGGLIQTTSFIRYTGAGSWAISQAGKLEQFFQQTFKRPLPIAVFGQGAIHNRWHLDHRNAMDVSLHPDGAEGQALIDFMRRNGIPFSAFRGAIPGVATGPHIHIGRPSSRY